jgi:hypothetical protein
MKTEGLPPPKMLSTEASACLLITGYHGTGSGPCVRHLDVHQLQLLPGGTSMTSPAGSGYM